MVYMQDPKPRSHPKSTPLLIPGSMKGCYHDAMKLPLSGNAITDREFCALARIENDGRRDQWVRMRLWVWKEAKWRREAAERKARAR